MLPKTKNESKKQQTQAKDESLREEIREEDAFKSFSVWGILPAFVGISQADKQVHAETGIRRNQCGGSFS